MHLPITGYSGKSAFWPFDPTRLATRPTTLVPCVLMKGILRTYVTATFSLFLTSLLFSGLIIDGGLGGYLVAGLLLAVGFLIVKPVLNIITLPLNMVTFGLFSIITNMLILYLVDVLFPPLQIVPFTVPEFSFVGITIQSFYASTFLSYLLISATIYAIQKGMLWLFDS